MNKDKKWDFPTKKTRSKKAKTEAMNELIAEKEAELLKLKEAAAGGNITDIVGRAIEISSILEEVKELYKEQDEIIEQLLETGKTQFKHEDGILTLVDSFTEKNKRWKSVPFSRFVVEVTGRN
jgi:hypothetical protein